MFQIIPVIIAGTALLSGCSSGGQRSQPPVAEAPTSGAGNGTGTPLKIQPPASPAIADGSTEDAGADNTPTPQDAGTSQSDAGPGPICPPILPPTTSPLINENMDQFNSALWSTSNDWSNGAPFDCGWRSDHVSFSGGLMTLQIDNAGCPSGCSGEPYAAGEFRSLANYGYGLLEGRFKPAPVSGTDTSLFFYTGPSEGNPWDELDIEILGKDTTRLQTNYIVKGVGGHEEPDENKKLLGFDAAQDFHEYAVQWSASTICWYVDRQLFRRVDGSDTVPLPTTAGKIMMNLWTGDYAWTGPFNYTGPVTAQYDWVKYSAL